MNVLRYIGQDLAANRNNTKGKLLAILFRSASLAASRKVTRVIFFPYLAFYKLFVEWTLGVELPWGTRIGPGLRIFHGQAIVINRQVRIGSHCTLRQSTTLGNARDGEDCPVIGNNVEIGSNVCIIGPVRIGDNVTIGAGSVVIKNIPAGSIAVGNPATIIKRSIETPCVQPAS
jgi:putative colanic acid biosynthesis acetyltransferase WcaB